MLRESDVPLIVMDHTLDRTSRKGRRPSDPSDPSDSPSPDARPSLRRMLRSLVRPIDSRSSAPMRDARYIVELCRSLLSEQGEPSGARLATEVLDAYGSLDSAARGVFFDLLVTEFSPNPVELGRAADAYRVEPSQANLVRLQAAAEPPRQELFRRFNLAPGGTAVLVSMRGQLLKTLGAHPERVGVDADLAHLFRSWFNRGFLFLQRIEWRTSALVLERLIKYEAVHQIQGWRDLRRRLEADRRCYAFFHPALPDEPLIFIEVALARGMQAKVQPLLDPDAPVMDPAKAECAVFYSITNCQDGLRGVSFGSSLIKQVAEELGREFPRLKTFATLSPVPSFGEWLANGDYPLTVGEYPTAIWTMIHKLRGHHVPEPSIAPAIQTALSRLCAYYLMYAKRGKAPLDPVARFHLANGARLERLNWMGDTSPTGLTRSLGFTVNYVYRLADVEHNHGAYAKAYAIVASGSFQRLAKRGQRANASQAPSVNASD
jgi:malonyl-CoA decarboxylase